MMRNKKGFEFSFAWIFAIFIGAVIIFLAVFAAMKAIGIGKISSETESAKELTILFEPLETKTSTGLKIPSIELMEEIKLSNTCFDTGKFGEQRFQISIQSGFFKKWEESGFEISERNKYIFSDSNEVGKKFYVATMPFNIPFKVANLIFISAKKYCFENAPDYVKNDVEKLGLENINLKLCKPEEIKVSFSGNSDIKVDSIDEFSGIVKKNGKELYYSGNLLYAAIFSSPEVYDCNVKRLLARLKVLNSMYNKESSYLASKCGSVPISSLMSFNGKIGDKITPQLIEEADKLNWQNEGAECALW